MQTKFSNPFVEKESTLQSSQPSQQAGKHSPAPWSLHIGEDYVRIDSKDGLNDVLPETMIVSEEDAILMTAAPDSDRILRVIKDWMDAGSNEIHLGTLMQDEDQGEQTIGEAITEYFAKAATSTEAT